jgi:EmrB/QacA subfamily drug resistance transporter
MSSTLAPQPEAPPAPSDRRADRRMWVAFSVILTTTILNILDSTIVNVAAPSIRADLAMSTSSLEWIAAAYTLALAVGLMTGGRLGDVLGRRRVLLAGLTGFVATSVVCSLAPNAGLLIGARALQGLTAALMVPQGFGLIREVFPPHRRAKAFAAMGPAIGLSTVLGPVVAGLLIRADVLGTGWRSLFLINVPLGLGALAVGWRVLPRSAPSHAGTRLDVVGTLLLAVASFALVFPLVDGRTLGWPVWVFAVLVGSVPLFALFIAQQRARLRAGRAPLVEISLLRKPSYVAGVVFLMVFFGCVVGLSLAIGVFLQVGLGLSPFTASLYLASLAVGSVFGAGVGAWAATAVGRPILHIGLTIMAVGSLVLFFSLRAAGADVGVLTLAPGLALFGLGMGMIFVPLFSIVMGEIDDHEVGSATGLLSSVEQLGASLGVAVLGTVFFNTIALEDGGPRAAMASGRHLLAAEHTLLVVVALIALAWGLGWRLPRKARAMH